MTPPKLTFFCELEADALKELFADGTLIGDLKVLKASVSLGIIDFSQERASVVSRLNQADIPVEAWLLLPKDQGYWFNVDNASQTITRYAGFKTWSVKYGLQWSAIGLDIEPNIRILQALAARKRRVLPSVLLRALKRGRLKRARAFYKELDRQIHKDGYRVHSYQFPVILDERKMGSTLLQRVAGLIDLPADQEVHMLYTSFLRPYGSGVLWSYAPEAQAIGLGSTGGGVSIRLGDVRPLEWEELARDLRHAWCWTDDLYIFSLEGCVRQGFISKLKNFEWDQPIIEPLEMAIRVDGWRNTFHSVLWISAHPWVILLYILVLFLLFIPLRRRKTV